MSACHEIYFPASCLIWFHTENFLDNCIGSRKYHLKCQYPTVKLPYAQHSVPVSSLGTPPNPQPCFIVPVVPQAERRAAYTEEVRNLYPGGARFESRLGYVYFPNIPAIATDNLYFFILFCMFITCFGPYGPSSGCCFFLNPIYLQSVVVHSANGW
jgi:hypothetical protein